MNRIVPMYSCIQIFFYYCCHASLVTMKIKEMAPSCGTFAFNEIFIIFPIHNFTKSFSKMSTIKCRFMLAFFFFSDTRKLNNSGNYTVIGKQLHERLSSSNIKFQALIPKKKSDIFKSERLKAQCDGAGGRILMIAYSIMPLNQQV